MFSSFLVLQNSSISDFVIRTNYCFSLSNSHFTGNEVLITRINATYLQAYSSYLYFDQSYLIKNQTYEA